MPRGDKSAYTEKQKRKAEHIEETYQDRGVSKKTAERRAWATVNKQDGGGKRRSGGTASGRSKTSKRTATRGSTRKTKSTGKSRR